MSCALHTCGNNLYNSYHAPTCVQNAVYMYAPLRLYYPQYKQFVEIHYEYSGTNI